MSRAAGYGQSFAIKKLTDGKPEEALVEADKAVASEPEDPDTMLDRAEIHFALRHWEEGLADVRRARELDVKAQILDDDSADDLTFSSLVEWGKELLAKDNTAAQEVLKRYAEIFPEGSHLGDVDTWHRRFGGEARTSWTKTH